MKIGTGTGRKKDWTQRAVSMWQWQKIQILSRTINQDPLQYIIVKQFDPKNNPGDCKKFSRVVSIFDVRKCKGCLLNSTKSSTLVEYFNLPNKN